MVKQFLILLIISLISLSLGYFFHDSLKHKILRTDVLSTSKECQYTFVNQLRCEPDQNRKKKEFASLRNELIAYIEQQTAQKKVQSVSVYFRDLQNGPIMGINGGENFTPASLLKLPLLIAFYKKAEVDPSLLTKEITIPDTVQALSQNVAPDTVAVSGKKYTIEQLIEILIKESDNTSGQVLLAYLNANYPQENFIFTLSDLGIIDPRKDIDEQYVTAQSYSSIFRILYNSSYLNLEMSNKALELLTTSDFKRGIVAGLPQNIPVAHKFGERRLEQEQQLHDCGIIYYEVNPYMLCIMTRGTNTEDLEEIIQHISREVYNEVSDRI